MKWTVMQRNVKGCYEITVFDTLTPEMVREVMRRLQTPYDAITTVVMN